MSLLRIRIGIQQQTTIARSFASTTRSDSNVLIGGTREAMTSLLSFDLHQSTKLNKKYRHLSSAYSAIPDTIKESIKSSILDEAAKQDSLLWDEKPSSLKVAGSLSANGINGHYRHSVARGKVDIEQHLSEIVDVDTPVNKPDPLDEWHLSAVSARKQSKYSKTINGSHPDGKTLLTIPEGVAPLAPDINDPFVLSRPDVHDISATIGNDLVGTDHPVLNSAARYFFNSEDSRGKGKQVRPVMVMLLSRAMMRSNSERCELDSNHPYTAHILKSQRRLAEITEMIHTASLFHDDVIDEADTRRGQPAAHRAFGNKMAILAGDYLLARASISLARLRNVDVVECMSTVIEHLVRGEVLQIKNSRTGVVDMEGYLRKNFYKTASLMANSCKSAALLRGSSPDIVKAAYLYGKHIGVAFQLIDDALDFEGSAASLGKPALADLNAGLSTAPVLFAAESHEEELIPAMARKFKEVGDIDLALRCIHEADGVNRTKELAAVHAEIAMGAVVEAFEPSPYRDSLVHLACRVVDRKK